MILSLLVPTLNHAEPSGLKYKKVGGYEILGGDETPLYSGVTCTRKEG